MTDDARKPRMVCWYEPRVLARSAWLMTLANIFGRYSDRRLIEALSNRTQDVFRCEPQGSDGELWLDFVSDVGDGFDPTFAVARGIAAPQLDFGAAGESAIRTKGGSVLVFGGDLVYPYPSRLAYAERTEQPYSLAFDAAARHPQVFAMPGNHDWMDGLIAFSRAFCRPDRGFAGCATPQTRSYFALQLPGDWWLLAIDLQCGADLDEPQEQYFREVAARMPADAHVILCVPEPQWIYAASYPGKPEYSDSVLRYFEESVLRRRVAVFLTGDLHHYKRHQDADGRQKIISGGGGAFLHPTHVPADPRIGEGFEQQACYPDAASSKRLIWRNWLFPLLNPWFMPLIGGFYLLSAWFIAAAVGSGPLVGLQEMLLMAGQAAVLDPVSGLWLLGSVAAIIFFTDTHVFWYRLVGGVTHAASHLCTAFLCGWCGAWLATEALGLASGSVAAALCAGLFTLLGGGLAGSMVLGGYLFFSLRLFGRHANEAFSSLRIADYKQWLRLCVERSGALRIHAIGIRRVSRRGRRNATVSSSAPQLIEALRLVPAGGGRYRIDTIASPTAANG
ncbi:MAG: metallophosphoesterase [Gammaproteobacteria bacterium]|nr:metallophosphoesterase [Gammaproteobacteria bacterium]